jgi:hypothetical protein
MDSLDCFWRTPPNGYVHWRGGNQPLANKCLSVADIGWRLFHMSVSNFERYSSLWRSKDGLRGSEGNSMVLIKGGMTSQNLSVSPVMSTRLSVARLGGRWARQSSGNHSGERSIDPVFSYRSEVYAKLGLPKLNSVKLFGKHLKPLTRKGFGCHRRDM